MEFTEIHIVGARPNFMKAAPVVQALNDRGAPPLLVHSGQHYDRALSGVFFDQLHLPEPDLNLGVGSGTHAAQTAALMVAFEKTFVEHGPSRVVVYGDINSTLAAAVVAAKMDIPLAHVEAGLRSFDRTMPEEVNRIVTDVLSDLHFVTSPEAVDQLTKEGIPGAGVHFVGNPMIDTLVRFHSLLDPDAAKRTLDIAGDYAVATLHRPSNVDDPGVAASIVDGLGRVAKSIPIVIALHPRGREVLEQAGLSENPGIHVVEPLGYLEFMSLMSGARLILTDSGGIQEETTILGIPCLTLRHNTERPITVTMGTNQLVGTDAAVIAETAENVLAQPPTGSTPPLWDGKAGQRIAEILLEDREACS